MKGVNRKSARGYLIGPDKVLFVLVEDVSELTLDGVNAEIQIFQVSFIHFLAERMRILVRFNYGGSSII